MGNQKMRNYWTKNEASFEVPMTFEKVIVNFLFEKGKQCQVFPYKKVPPNFKRINFLCAVCASECVHKWVSAQMSVCVCVCVCVRVCVCACENNQRETEWDSINQLGFSLNSNSHARKHTRRERERMCVRKIMCVCLLGRLRERG